MGEIILGGRYVIENEIGTGGMAIVYKAHDKLLNRSVAIKVLRPEFKQDEEFIRRFDIEAKSAAGLNHPNIVAIYDVGIHEGLRYIVMEYVQGNTLKDVIRNKGALPWEQALKYARQICAALTHAHERKIIHRDIKPQNIMVTEDGSLKVMDFGIARATSASTMTMGAKVLGSAHYLSPEQARGGFTDERSDLYSLGVCIYEMITGKVPFDAETTVAVAMQHLQKDVPSPKNVVTDLPPSVEHIIMKAMKKELSQRYLSALSMESDIIRALADPTAIPDNDENASFYSTRQIDIIEEEIPRKKKEKKKKNVMGVVSLILIGVLIALALAFWVIFTKVSDKEDKDEMVPQLIGLTEEEAKEVISGIDEGITISVNEEWSEVEEKGKVTRQTPSPGKKFPANGYVYITIGKGPEKIVLQNFTGRNIEAVKKELEEYGVVCEWTYSENDDDNEKYPKEDTIISQEPEAGKSLLVGAGDVVTFVISKGDGSVDPKIPDVEGMDVEDAKEMLEEKGFVNISETPEASKEKPGTIIRQEPESGVRLAVEDEIILIVAEIPKVPDLMGMGRGEAVEILEEMGYEEILIVTEISDKEPGTVIAQEPERGEEWEFEETIELVIAELPAVPDVVGMNQESAEDVLEDAGYRNIIIKEEESAEEAGTVIRQTPSKNEKLALDENVELVIAKSITPKKSELKFTVPEIYTDMVVVKVSNRNNGAVIYKNNHMPLEEVVITVNLMENEVGRYEIYINETFYEEMRVEG